jgi:hypothetical protein
LIENHFAPIRIKTGYKMAMDFRGAGVDQLFDLKPQTDYPIKKFFFNYPNDKLSELMYC